MTTDRFMAVVLLLLLGVSSPARAGDDALLQEGLSLLKAGRAGEAVGALHQAERRLPDPRRAAPLLGEAYLLQAMQTLQAGDEAGARAAFAEAKRYLPDDPRPRQGMALAWLHAGQPLAAIGELQEALAIAGERADLLILLGRAHYAAGDLAQAEYSWQQAAELGAGGEGALPLLEKVRRERQVEGGMRRSLGGRFVLAHAPEIDPRLAEEVLDELQDAYAELGSDLGFYPDTDIPVLLYARADFAAVTRSPEWAGAVYDGKIRVPLGGVRHMTPPLRALLHHEYTHVLVRFLGKGRAPVWLNEGLAEVAGRREDAPAWRRPAAGPEPGDDALDRPFTELPAEQVPFAYQRSHERVARMVELCGWSPLGELLQRLGRDEPWAEAVAAAYAPCGYDWPRLRDEWGGKTPRR